MKVGNLVKIIDPGKQSWIKNNPWMALKWELHTIYIVTEEKMTNTKNPVSLYKIVNTRNGDYKWAKAEEIEVFSEAI